MSEASNDTPCTCAPVPYIATKIVEAVPMRLGQFHDTHPGQSFPGNREDEGYCVIYPQIGEKKPYHGWCPKSQFEAQNQDPRKGMTFGHALEMLKIGKKVARAGWNGKGMYLWVLPGANVPADWCKEPHLKSLAEANGGHVECLPSVRMFTADHKVLTGWLASQTDMFATDWVLVG